MREIKFRAWHADRGMSDIPVSINLNSNGVLNGAAIWQRGFNVELYGANDIVWMQYTGLKDKNGVEIYEGDIVRYLIPKEVIVQVAWDDGEAGFRFGYLAGRYDDKEVIGNIYESPELLEVK